MIRWWWFPTCLLMFLLGGCATSGQGAVEAIPIGHDAPDFAANRLEGGSVQLSSLRGRVVVLDVWAAWCEGCEKDLPVLDGMASRLKSSGVEVLAVSIDSTRERLAPLVHGRSWSMLLLHDPTGRVADLYKPAKMPAVFTIDRTGKVRHARFGPAPSDIADVEAEARALAQAGKD